LIADLIEEAERRIKELKADWDTMLVIARQNEERELRKNIPPNTYVNGLHGEGQTSNHVRFRILRHLGTGSYGDVSEMQEVSTGNVYARKLICYHDESEAKRVENEVKNEVKVMQRLRHHHIASVLLWIRDMESKTFSIFMLPVADFDLAFYLDERCAGSGFDRSQVKLMEPWFGCLVTALAFAHGLRIKHEDIKPSNILIKDGSPYLADFGSAKDFSGLDRSITTDESNKGTPKYLAPEERPGEPKGRATDIFALGCVFCEMLAVRQGISREEFHEIRQESNYGLPFRDTLQNVYQWLEELDDLNEAGEVIRDVTRSMLNPIKEERPDARKLRRQFRGEETLICAQC